MLQKKKFAERGKKGKGKTGTRGEGWRKRNSEKKKRPKIEEGKKLWYKSIAQVGVRGECSEARRKAKKNPEISVRQTEGSYAITGLG